RQEIVQNHPLIMPPDLSLDFREGGFLARLAFQLVSHPVMESQKKRVQLGDDYVLIIARITDESMFAVLRGRVAQIGLLGTRNIICITCNELLMALIICKDRQCSSESHPHAVLAEQIWVVVRTSPVNTIQIESRRSIIHH